MRSSDALDEELARADAELARRRAALDDARRVGDTEAGEGGARAEDLDVQALGSHVEHVGELRGVNPAAIVVGGVGVAEAQAREGQERVVPRARDGPARAAVPAELELDVLLVAGDAEAQ